jgi:hypothetical protein
MTESEIRQIERDEIADFIQKCADRSGEPAKESLVNISRTVRALTPEQRESFH